MNRMLRARYEDGVFRPLDRVDLPEGTTVEMTIVPPGWDERFRRLVERIRARAKDVDAAEIEAEISRAADEVRAERSSGA